MASLIKSKAVIFAEVPNGVPKPGKDLILKETEFDTAQSPPKGGFTLKMHYSSFDPYMRNRMRSPEAKSYSPPFTLGQPIASGGIATVLKSSNTDFAEGDLITGMLPMEEYSVVTEETIVQRGLRKIVNPLSLDPTIFLGTLGMPGLTAYSSFYEIGKPKKGETIFISAASGAVGQMVGQIAKHEGLKVIGSVGSDEKLEYILKELDFDGGFNYKKETAEEALTKLAPNGIDIYYENVGGEQLVAAIDHMNDFGRVIMCGMVSNYNKPREEHYPVRNLMRIVEKRLTIRGFIVSDANMGPVYREEFVKNVSSWVAKGEFKVLTSVTDGIDNAPEGFVGMLQGKNMGKAILKISDLKN